jgi:hypothetical protein
MRSNYFILNSEQASLNEQLISCCSQEDVSFLHELTCLLRSYYLNGQVRFTETFKVRPLSPNRLQFAVDSATELQVTVCREYDPHRQGMSVACRVRAQGTALRRLRVQKVN